MRALTMTLALFFLSGTAIAQNDSKITTGVVAYQQGDFFQAEQSLRAGLEYESMLKEKNIAKGWYHLGLSLMGIVQTANREKDTQTLQKYAGAFLEAYNCFVLAIEKDMGSGTYGPQAVDQLKSLFNSLLQLGLQYMNSGLYNDAMPYFDAAATISQNMLDEENYLVYDLRAQARLAQSDTLGARADFIKAKEIFSNFPPDQPDQLIAYVYYRLALLASYQDNAADQVLEILREGMEVLEKEHSRLRQADYTAEYWAALSEQYETAKADLSAFELDILLNSPDKLKQALEKFDKAVKEDPQNYIKQVAYARLLEKVDQEKAISVYKKAITIDDRNVVAFFNLGALYVNRAAEVSKKAMETDDFEKAKKYEAEVNQHFKNALPYLEKAYRISPSDLTIIRALKQVTIYLEMTEDYQKYKEAERVLTGG
ncbi:MAG: hypothetical protein KDC85_17965 [Saprospiraceae bacterium]|nr:hypothetical protein [Saprospiraceae bacterium]MCB9325341.1 hypothetical protein [Lewinellaceae bacterium]